MPWNWFVPPLLIWLYRMPPLPYCAENSESLIFTSATESKIGVLMTLLLMGELVEAPSSRALEKACFR